MVQPAIAGTLLPDGEIDTSILPRRMAPDAVGSRGWKLWNEESTHRAIVDAIDGATKVVNVEFFGLIDAGKGEWAVDALERAARRGIEVNVITDMTSYASLPLGAFHRMRRRLEAAGATVHTNLQLPFGPNKNSAKSHIDHRKVVVVDGEQAFTGGINYYKVEDDYHDSMLELSGPQAARLAAEQLDRWERINRGATDVHKATVRQALNGASLLVNDPNDMHLVTNAPEQGDFQLSDTYRDMIRNAKKRVWIASPSYTDKELMQLVDEAAERGVDVRLIAPGEAPIGLPLILWVNRTHLRDLQRKGGKAYEIPEVLHRKSLIVDDEVVFSSFNMTGRSKKHDHEIGVRTKDPEFVRAIEQVLERDMARALPVEQRKRSAGESLTDFLVDTLKLSY